jgi:hypothetical protein
LNENLNGVDLSHQENEGEWNNFLFNEKKEERHNSWQEKIMNNMVCNIMMDDIKRMGKMK